MLKEPLVDSTERNKNPIIRNGISINGVSSILPRYSFFRSFFFIYLSLILDCFLCYPTLQSYQTAKILPFSQNPNSDSAPTILYAGKSLFIMTTTSLSINLSLSPPPFSTSAAVATTTSFYEAPSSLRFPHSRSLTSNPRSLFCEIFRFRCLEGSLRNKGSGFLSVKANNMTIAEVRPEDGEEDSPPLLDPETNSKPRRIALFVEPSPFA